MINKDKFHITDSSTKITFLTSQRGAKPKQMQLKALCINRETKQVLTVVGTYNSKEELISELRKEGYNVCPKNVKEL